MFSRGFEIQLSQFMKRIPLPKVTEQKLESLKFDLTFTWPVIYSAMTASFFAIGHKEIRLIYQNWGITSAFIENDGFADNVMRGFEAVPYILSSKTNLGTSSFFWIYAIAMVIFIGFPFYIWRITDGNRRFAWIFRVTMVLVAYFGIAYGSAGIAADIQYLSKLRSLPTVHFSFAKKDVA